MSNYLSLVLLLALGACQYDIDKIYAYPVHDAGSQVLPVVDAGTPAPDVINGPLINAWSGYPTVDAECIACATEKCAEVERACREDPDCFEYTKCIARNPTPSGQVACRQVHSVWARAGTVRERDLSGPYGQCVFRDHCAVECDGNSDLSCLGKYSWPTTPGSSVPMHLYLTDAREPTKVVPNVNVRACVLSDPTCANSTASTTDEHGMVELQLPAGALGLRAFSGFLELTGDDIYPTLLKFGWNIAGETTQVVNVVSKSLFALSTGSLGIVPDPTRGGLQIRMLGCQGSGIKGAAFDIDPPGDEKTKTWYVATVPGLAVGSGGTLTGTDAVGSGGIIDVPVGGGTIPVRATRQVEPTPVVELARTVAPIRAQHLTIVVFAPNAAQ